MSTRLAIPKTSELYGARQRMVKAFRASSGVQSRRMSDHDREVLARTEAEQADRAYNDAITALDHAIIPPDEEPGPILPWPDAVLPPPGGPHKPWLRVIHRWLAPVFARQRTFDNHVVDAVEALVGHERATEFARFQTALIVFLQKITAFVESKDRLVAAAAATRLDPPQQRPQQPPGPHAP